MSNHFFVIGGQRCGTTYLYHHLDAHPEIEMAKPVCPEPKFFYLDSTCSQDVDEYCHRFFPDQSPGLVRGEKSTVYYESEPAAKRISASFEKPKIILIVRDPIDRAISNYRFSVHHGLETLPMEEAFRREHGRIDNYDKNQVSISPFAYLSRGKYIDHISVYDRYFPRNQFKIIVFEELIRDVRVIQEIYSFLEVDSNFTSKHAEDAVNSSPGGDQELSSGLRHWLNDYFSESNYQLSLRLNRSMEIWNCVKEGD